MPVATLNAQSGTSSIAAIPARRKFDRKPSANRFERITEDKRHIA
jgi:hypothetical protein